MTRVEFAELSAGDLVTPLRRSNNKGDLFKVIAVAPMIYQEGTKSSHRRFWASNDVLVEIVGDKKIDVPKEERLGIYPFVSETRRCYKHQMLKIVSKATDLHFGKPIYPCDRKKCKVCHPEYCSMTTDINHAC